MGESGAKLKGRQEASVRGSEKDLRWLGTNLLYKPWTGWLWGGHSWKLSEILKSWNKTLCSRLAILPETTSCWVGLLECQCGKGQLGERCFLGLKIHSSGGRWGKGSCAESDPLSEAREDEHHCLAPDVHSGLHRSLPVATLDRKRYP